METEKIVIQPEVSKIGRSFRNCLEMELFYRFVHDHGLRIEAHKVMKYIFTQMTGGKKKGERGSKGAGKNRAKAAAAKAAGKKSKDRVLH
jgi:hypothetical protein